MPLQYKACEINSSYQETPLNLKQAITAHREQIISVFVLFIVASVSYGTFNSGIISSDDWSYFVAKYVFGNLRPINLTDRRPLILVIYYGLASLFGLQLEYYYIFNFLILFLTAFMLYAIIDRVFPNQKWIASLVAIIYLIYPVDYTRTWVIMIYIRFWWLVSLGVIWLLLEYAETGKLWIYAQAMLGTAFPLGAYEGQFGIILLACAAIALFLPKIPVKRRFVIPAGIIGIGVLFLFWRTFVQTRFLSINDAYVGGLQFSPAILFDRYLQGLLVFFKDWSAPILVQLQQSGYNLVSWFLAYILLCTIIILWISLRSAPTKKTDARQRLADLRLEFIIFIVGAAFWVAGFIPIIALYSPSLSGHATRVNLFAIPGAAMMLVSAVTILTGMTVKTIPVKRALTWSILLPFIFAGIFAQRQVAYESNLAWETQKTIWKSVFDVIPNIRNDKSLVIIIPGYKQLRPFESYPFLSGWEIEAGAQVLYNNHNISANYYYKDLQPTDLLFTPNGYRPLQTDKIIPYKKLIFVYYNPQSKSAELVENLEETLALPFTTNNYTPRENIIQATPSTANFRWLVQ